MPDNQPDSQRISNRVAVKSRTSELSARCAVLVARLYATQGWRWGGWSKNRPAYVPDAEAIAECIDSLVLTAVENGSLGGISTGRLMARTGSDGDLDVYLHLGTLDKYGQIHCDDEIEARRAG